MTLKSLNIGGSYMQFVDNSTDKSHFSFVASDTETERQIPDPDLPQPKEAERQSRDTSNRFVNQRLHTLRLSARQVLAQGGIPGQTPPYLPQGPSLFREAPEQRPSRSPSPLRQLALSTYSPSTSRKRHFSPPYGASLLASRGLFTMPHAVSMPQAGFQALILCGPGIGLSTFTNVPQEYPKALVSIANRPMIWYVLDWCYRMGVIDITLISPPTSKAPIAAALAQNPYLTSLPTPTPDLLAPAELEFNTPTAELLRLPEVQKVIKSDFLLLPCDLVCDISGDAFIESYLTSMGGFGGVGASTDSKLDKSVKQNLYKGGEVSGRRGGLSIWYSTVGKEESVKHEECDFMGTVGLDSQNQSSSQKISDLPKGRLRKLVWTMPMSELFDTAEEDKSWKIRQSLLRRYGSVKCLTQYRDAHIYFFPYWAKDFAKLNEDFESVSEDLVGTWVKEDWRKASYRARFGAKKIFKPSSKLVGNDADQPRAERPIEEEIDLLALSSTQVSRQRPDRVPFPDRKLTAQLASRVRAKPGDTVISPETPGSPSSDADENGSDDTTPLVPPMLSYILASDLKTPFIRRVDTTPLLLSVSLLLAKIPSIEETSLSGKSSSPLAHPSKVSPTATIAPRVTVSRGDVLIDANTTINSQCVIKTSVIGSSVLIGQGSRITNCVIMDGATIGEKCILTGCVVGKKAKIGKDAVLNGCEVQDGNVLGDGVEGKNEKYLVGGLEDEVSGDDFGFGDDGGEGDEDGDSEE